MTNKRISNTKIRRVYTHAAFLLKQDLTVRQIAKKTGWGKSTVHRDLHNVLRTLDDKTFKKVDVVLKRHKLEARKNKNKNTKGVLK